MDPFCGTGMAGAKDGSTGPATGGAIL